MERERERASCAPQPAPITPVVTGGMRGHAGHLGDCEIAKRLRAGGCNGGAMEVQWRDICCRIRHVLMMREEAEAEAEGEGLWEEEGCTEEYTQLGGTRGVGNNADFRLQSLHDPGPQLTELNMKLSHSGIPVQQGARRVDDAQPEQLNSLSKRNWTLCKSVEQWNIFS